MSFSFDSGCMPWRHAHFCLSCDGRCSPHSSEMSGWQKGSEGAQRQDASIRRILFQSQSASEVREELCRSRVWWKRLACSRRPRWREHQPYTCEIRHSGLSRLPFATRGSLNRECRPSRLSHRVTRAYTPMDAVRLVAGGHPLRNRKEGGLPARPRA
ncbi:hypothetical protein LY78DRAFT_126485 [Colletotrichum sublineola]|nr:hypothetical protein LY78DRAFT_126485 [Colletotrichum sublineola]